MLIHTQEFKDKIMINKVCISFLMLLLVIGCANQQQQEEAENTPEEATISEAKAEVEEVSLTVTGMT